MPKGNKGHLRRVTSTLVVEAYCPLCERSFPEALEICPDDGARLIRLTQQEVDLVGKTFDGRFEIKDLLGDGGMGAVYRAVDLQSKRPVAIKVIRSELTNDIGVAKRFLREARVSSGLDHPNTVTVYDYGQTADGILFLSMELLDGQTLEDALAAHGRMPPGRVGHVGCQIFEALDCAHRKMVIHRDLKPSNVMLLPDNGGRDLVKVLDFGLAKSLGSDFNTTAGFLMGTPAYLAPEIILRGEVNFPSDLYAVGVLMYEVLAGHVPFQDEEIPAVLMAHAHRPPPPLPPDIPGSIAEFVMRLLAKRPSDRFESALAACRALEVAMEDLTDTNTDVDPGRSNGRTTEMVRLSQSNVDWLGEDSEAGTLRSGEVYKADVGLQETHKQPVLKPDTDKQAVITAPSDTDKQPVLTEEDSDKSTPMGKGKRAVRRSFIGSRTKLLTPVPPVHTINREILDSGDDEAVTREMEKLMAPHDTDEMTAEDPDTDQLHAIGPDTEEFDAEPTMDDSGRIEAPQQFGSGQLPRFESGRLPAPGLGLGMDEGLTNEMPAQSFADLEPSDFDNPGALSTAIVDRERRRSPREAERKTSSMSLMWLGFAVAGVGAGILAWWLLGS